MSKMLEMAIAIKGKLDGSLGGSISKAIAQTQQMKEAIKSTNQEIAKLQKQGSRGELLSQAQRMQKNLNGMNQEMAKLQMQAGKEDNALSFIHNQMEQLALQEKINKAAAEYAPIQARLNRIKKKEEASQKFETAKGHLETAVIGTAAVAAPIVAATAAAIKFESAMANVRKTVDFDTPDQFKRMNQDILQLSQHLPMSAEGIAKIVAAGGQAGIARGDLMAFAQDAVKMGIAFDITADQAGDMMAKWRTAFGMNQDEVVRLADQVNYLSNVTAASSGDISDIVTRVGPLGEVAGVNAAQIAAMGASMASVGIKSEIASTGIKNLMLGLTSGAGATKTQAAAFMSLGLTAEDVAASMQTNAEGTIMNVLQRVKELPKEVQASTLADLFGTESISAIAPLLTQLDNLQENFNRVGDASQYAGSMEAEYQSRSQSTANQIELAKNNLTVLAINIGSILLPSINAFLESISGIASSMAEWAQQHQTLTGVILGTIGVVAALIVTCMAINAVIAGVSLVVATYRIFKDSVMLASAATKIMAVSQAILNAVMAANPIVFIIVAVIALIAALVYLWNTNEAFRNAVINAWNALKAGAVAAFNGIMSALSAVFEAIPTIILGVINGIIFAIGAIIGFISVLPEAISRAITAAGEFLMDLVTYCVNAGAGFIAAAEEWASSAYDTVTSWLSNLVSSAADFLSGLPDACAEAGARFVEAAGQWASDAYTSVMDWINRLPGAITDAISGAWDGIVAKFSAGFTVGVRAGAGSAEGAGEAASAGESANGGVFNHPYLTWVAEAGHPEVIVPITHDANAYGLLATAGRMLGVTLQAASVPTVPISNNGNSTSIFFSPSVTVHGGNADIVGRVDAVLNDKMKEFERLMNQYRARQRRLSYD